MQRAQKTGASRLLVAACAVLAMLVVLLSWQNHRLKTGTSVEAAQAAPNPALPAAGEVVAPFRVVGDDAFPVEIAFENGSGWTVVFLFTMECPACQDTLPLWRELVDDLAAPGVRIVGLRLDERPGGPPSGNLHAGLGFPVYLLDEEPPGFVRGALRVPATLVIDDSGTIANAVYGVPSQRQLVSILQTLSQGT